MSDISANISRRDFLKLSGVLPVSYALKDIKLDALDYSVLFSNADLVRLVDRGEKITNYKDYYSSHSSLKPESVDNDQFEKLSNLTNLEPYQFLGSKITWLTQRSSPDFSNEYSSQSPDSETALIDLANGERHAIYKFPGGNIVTQNLRDLFDDYETIDFFSIYQNGILERSHQAGEKGLISTIAMANWGQFEIIDQFKSHELLYRPGRITPAKLKTDEARKYHYVQSNDHKLLRYLYEENLTKIQVVSASEQKIREFSSGFQLMDINNHRFVFTSGDLIGLFRLEEPKADNQRQNLIFSVQRNNQSSEILLNLNRQKFLSRSMHQAGVQVLAKTNFVGEYNVSEYFFQEETIPNGVIFVKKDYFSPSLPWIFVSTGDNGQVILNENQDTVKYINSLNIPEMPIDTAPMSEYSV